MAVLTTLRLSADPKKFEEFAADENAPLIMIRDRAVERGCTSHHFYATDDEILVVDEWPDEASFRGFFDASPEIKDALEAVGITAPPEIKVWRKLETRDEI
jgi:quinol monooxygenase YgiN